MSYYRNQKKKQNEDDWFINWIKDRGLGRYTKQLLLVKEWTITIIYALLLATLFKTFFYENFKIPSGSMNPLLLEGDRILVNKYHYGYSKFSFPFDIIPIKERILKKRMPQRWDLVVFKTKESEKTGIYYIKRIVGLPKDKIQVKDNRLFINGVEMAYQKMEILPAHSEYNHNFFVSEKQVESDGVNSHNVLISDVNSISGNTKEYIVPEGEYFCMGDNRDNSKDSRFPDFGTIPYRNIIGKAERIFFSTANGGLNFNRIFQKIK